MSWFALTVALALWLALLVAALLLVQSWELDYDLRALEEWLGLRGGPEPSG